MVCNFGIVIIVVIHRFVLSGIRPLPCDTKYIQDAFLRFRCLVMTEGLDTKNIMSASPSEAESWSRDTADTRTGLWRVLMSYFVRGNVSKEIPFAAEYPCKLSPRSYPTWALEKERQQKVKTVC